MGWGPLLNGVIQLGHMILHEAIKSIVGTLSAWFQTGLLCMYEVTAPYQTNTNIETKLSH